MTSLAGAVILPELQKTLLFKNRDLAASNHEDTIFYDVDCFGVKGIDAATGEIHGLAIGVNRYGLAVANTHVKQTGDPSYHTLTEQILMFGKDAEDGLQMTVDHLKSGRHYQWGNLILADNDSMIVIELAEDKHTIERSERKVLRTSHHIMLDTEEELRKSYSEKGQTTYEDSLQRFERGYELIRRVESVRDVFNILKDHGPERGASSLCKHARNDAESSTVMSYVIEMDHEQDAGRPKIVFHAAKGHPCEASYTSIPLVFPADEEIMKRARQIFPK